MYPVTVMNSRRDFLRLSFAAAFSYMFANLLPLRPSPISSVMIPGKPGYDSALLPIS